MSIPEAGSPRRQDVPAHSDAAAGPAAAFEPGQALADSVLYEGYLLYPYRGSSDKNRVRWQFGVLAPRHWIEARGPATDTVAGSAESWWQQTECLLEAPDSANLWLRPRFLQAQHKTVQSRGPDGSFRSVDRLDLADRIEVGFDEAVPHQDDVQLELADLLATEQTATLEAAGGEQVDPISDGNGQMIGRVIRSRAPVTAVLRAGAERVPAPFPLIRIRIRIEHAEPEAVDPFVERSEALRRALVSAHCLLAVEPGSFLSLLDPPVWATPAAHECRNVRTFPVLAGPVDTDNLVLSAPIILYDHAQIAPESPGDLHDATEIDELLSLRTLTLTDQEKREARGTDARSAAIIDRTDAMPPEVLDRLHGTVRHLDSADRNGSTEQTGAPTDSGSAATEPLPWWEPGADANVDPGTDTVVVDGVRIGHGSRVRIQPRRRGSDAHDMFLAGRIAQVEKVLLDVDGSRQVAVTIEDDPSAELHQWYGRFHYFRPDEIRPLAEEIS